jgi:hypothetical protein
VSSRHTGQSPLRLFVVNAQGRLERTPAQAMDPDGPDVTRFPYGAVVLPTADCHGNAVVVVTHPGCEGRTDVLLIETLPHLSVNCAASEQVADPRARHQGKTRVRVALQPAPGIVPELPTNCAVVRFAAGLNGGERLGANIRSALATVGYTIRVDDRTGWFEYGEEAFPDPAFQHGFPDIASREQGAAGIRGPSILAAGLQAAIAPAAFAPMRARLLDPGERVIYELHVGTFTREGTFAAAIDRLAYLRDKGFTTLLLMPVDISSGPPGWTYDQTRTSAVDNQSYGGASGLIQFVEQAHRHGLEVIVDKQYNHRGPEQDSRSEIIPGMFARDTIWGPGMSGREASHYSQIVKLIGEEIVYWVSQFGLDGFRLDATNRLPWELHGMIAGFARQSADVLGKPIYVISEYAECDEPRGERVPTGHQYTDQAGRYVMKMMGLSQARHVTTLPAENGSLLRPLLKAAKRGWWYPDVPQARGGLRGSERITTLLWHHDWIGNRFGGERIHHLIPFELFKALAVWQALGQWTPLVFMGTERYADTPWFYFSGHRDRETRNGVSAHYSPEDTQPVLCGGRFHEFAPEAREAGLREALAFSADGTIDNIDWQAFREQLDRRGRPYMDHALLQTFYACKIDWEARNARQHATERLFERLLNARSDDRLKEDDPRHTQYKAWAENEQAFVLRRRAPDGRELAAFFNLGQQPVSFRVATYIQDHMCGHGYIVGSSDSDYEHEWPCAGAYSLWLDTNAPEFGGEGSLSDLHFDASDRAPHTLVISGATAVVYSRSVEQPGGRVRAVSEKSAGDTSA